MDDMEKQMSNVKNIGHDVKDFLKPDEPVELPEHEIFLHAKNKGAVVVTIEVSGICGRRPVSPILTDSFNVVLTEGTKEDTANIIRGKVDNCKNRVDALVTRWLEGLK
jgi:hypothetical protein